MCARQTFRMGGKRHRGPLGVQRARRTTLWALHVGHGRAGDLVWHQRNRTSHGLLFGGVGKKPLQGTRPSLSTSTAS
jgi:hypothetical protein